MTPIIEVKGLSKKYRIGENQPYLTLRDSLAGHFKNPFAKVKKGLQKDEFWALKDINFTVEPGEVVGIIGRNGAGKSTLLKILSRITPPTEGEIIMRGRVGSLLEVGTGFQQELTGRENIYLNGAILGMSQKEIKSKFDEIVDFAGVDKFVDTPVKHYSSGMYMRLAFSVAAHLDPSILLVDEVLAVGDSEFQKKCIGKMNQISQLGGKTIIFVSHNLSSIRQICDKVIILEHGDLTHIGETNKVLEHYAESLSKSILQKSWMGKSLSPQIEGVKIESVEIVDQEGNKVDNISTDDSFGVKINYRITIADSYLGFTLNLYDEDSQLVFSSISNTDSKFYNKKYPLGKYSTICYIPNNFLNNKSYSIDLNFYNLGFSNLKSIRSCLNISISDGNSVRQDYTGAYGGSLRPKLLWETIKE